MKFAILASLASIAFASPTTDANLRAVFNKHNEYRKTSAVSPPAASMPQLQWSSTLATVAKNYAAKCIWGHNPSRTTQQKQFSYVGENLSVRSGKDKTQAALGVVSWWAEKSFYTYSTGACQTGKMCGHYTQMAWAKTTHVGCAIATCSTMKGLDWCPKYGGCVSLVCNYGPGGNFNKEKPYVRSSALIVGNETETEPAPPAEIPLTGCKTTSATDCINIPSGFGLDPATPCFNMNGQGLFCFTGKTTATGHELSRCSKTTCPNNYDTEADASLSTDAKETMEVPAPQAPVLEMNAGDASDTSGAVPPLAFLALPAVVIASYL